MDGETTWIQCSKGSCGKWRIVSEEVAKKYDSKPWTCELNNNVLYNSCSQPEEEIDVPNGKKIVLTKLPYKNGEVVMAKLSGYCSWPALICPDPICELYYDAELNENEEEDEITYVHVEFFGSPRTHAWVTPKNITPFCMRQPNTSKTNKSASIRKSYLGAMEQAANILLLSCEERLQTCAFKTIEDLSKAKQKGSRPLKRERNTMKGAALIVRSSGRNIFSTREPNEKINSDEDQFLDKYEQFLAERGVPSVKNPVWCGKTISIHKIFQIVQNHGGYIEVTRRRKWLSLRDELLESNDPLVKPSGNLKGFYERNMLDFESYWNSRKYMGSKRSKQNPDEQQLLSHSQKPIPSVETFTIKNRDDQKTLDLVPGGSVDLLSPNDGNNAKEITIPPPHNPLRLQPHRTSPIKEGTFGLNIDCIPSPNPSSPEFIPVIEVHGESITSAICTKASSTSSSNHDKNSVFVSSMNTSEAQRNNNPYGSLNCFGKERLPMLYPKSSKPRKINMKGIKLLKMIDYVPSSNPASPQFPIEEDVDDDCGMSIKNELQEMENLLGALDRENSQQKERVEDLEETTRKHSLFKDSEVNNAIQEILEVEAPESNESWEVYEDFVSNFRDGKDYLEIRGLRLAA